jgi:hypothetical protein
MSTKINNIKVDGYLKFDSDTINEYSSVYVSSIIDTETVFPYYKVKTSNTDYVYLLFKKKRKYTKKEKIMEEVQ